MFKALTHAPRLLLEVPLRPVQGHRFQPTGFADLGHAEYTLPDGTRMLLVESAQSVANRLEATILTPGGELQPELEGLSWVKVQLSGASRAVTTSLVEAHRINSPFIVGDKAFAATLTAACGYAKGQPIDWQKAAAALYRYDVNSLLHGVFLANIEDGRLRFARALAGFVEATDVREVVSGGVKNNHLDPSGKIRAKGLEKDVYSNVPYQRVEYTAARITAYFNLDLSLLRSYALGGPAWELLVGLGLLKVRRFLDRGLRLRTACDLLVDGDVAVTAPQGFVLPAEDALLDLVQQRIASTNHLFANPAVTTLSTKVTLKK